MFPKGDFSLENFSSKYDPELCGKWKVLKPLLEQWKKAQFKVLLFSQSTKMMDILEYWLQQDFPEFVRLDGSVAIRERFKRVDEFQTDPSKFIFLASIKAAGVGLNLTAANKVVIFDVSGVLKIDTFQVDCLASDLIICVRLAIVESQSRRPSHGQGSTDWTEARGRMYTTDLVWDDGGTDLSQAIIQARPF
ncbi:excision repair cross-complementing rodent repair deficiency complementation group [Puccinia graminis f. sp. tritici]|uniref:Excision repair cross-complementing rodent repair deficiency complementation group n=1 Tax=Puccinia graminis f. sp. tritici TaxID=56615 RepID=A0A5B0RS92_PUCGR|nr:excision repair cross-complementing rodent repair deficiency complementation group [Puccinia graminis f. sp. tritici]